MQSSKLPSPLDISHLKTHDDIVSFLYCNYQRSFLDRLSRPKLFGKFIYVEARKVNGKADSFWHVVSLDSAESRSFRILPCNNDVTYSICPDNCIAKNHTVVLLNGTSRDICYYRGTRLNWIPSIITLANNQDPSIKMWRKGNLLHIRFQHESADYIVLLTEIYNSMKGLTYYIFVSAFPVFYLNKKRDYDNDYRAFISQNTALVL